METTPSTDAASKFIAHARPTVGEYCQTTVALIQPFLMAAVLLRTERIFFGTGPSRAAYIPAIALGMMGLGMVFAAVFAPNNRTFLFADDALTVEARGQSVTIRRADVAAVMAVGANVILVTKPGMYLQCYLPADLNPLRSRLLTWCDCLIETRSLFVTNFLSASWLSTSASAVAFAAPHPFAVRTTFAVVFAASLLGWLIDIAASPVALRQQKRTNVIITVAFSLVAGTIFSRI